MRNKVFLFFSSIIFCGMFVLMLEVATRLLFPEINLQGIDDSLFRENAYDSSFGWRPNATGTCYGVDVFIDKTGFRKMASPHKYDSSWLILGDSVTFDVGVDVQDTYVGMLQSRYPTIKLWNTAVVGYTIKQYNDVVNHLLDSKYKLRKVILFLSLHDIYGNPNVTPVIHGSGGRILIFLKSNSKLYMLIKNTSFDRSRSFFLYDEGRYNEKGKKKGAVLYCSYTPL